MSQFWQGFIAGGIAMIIWIALILGFLVARYFKPGEGPDGRA